MLHNYIIRQSYSWEICFACVNENQKKSGTLKKNLNVLNLFFLHFSNDTSWPYASASTLYLLYLRPSAS